MKRPGRSGSWPFLALSHLTSWKVPSHGDLYAAFCIEVPAQRKDTFGVVSQPAALSRADASFSGHPSPQRDSAARAVRSSENSSETMAFS